MRRTLLGLIALGTLTLGLASCSRTLPGDDVGLTGLPQFECVTVDLGNRTTALYEGSTAEAENFMTGSCGGENAPDQAFVWTVPVTGLYSITTDGSGFDTILYLYNGSCSADEVACSDNGGFGGFGRIDVNAEAGAQIVIVVDGVSGASGPFQLRIDPS